MLFSGSECVALGLLIPFMATILHLLLLSRLTSAAVQRFNLTLTSGWAAPGTSLATCLTLDGYWRQTYLVNEQFPGPLIAVDEGDEIGSQYPKQSSSREFNSLAW